MRISDWSSDVCSSDLFLVMRPKTGKSTVKVYIDDKVQYFGADNINGIVTINSDKLYKLVDLPTPGRHILRIEFEDSNTERSEERRVGKECVSTCRSRW